MSFEPDTPSVFLADTRIDYLNIKVASRCNIRCDYCYWFADRNVLLQPKVMSKRVVHQLALRLRNHVVSNDLSDFHLLFHGGEPLLWGIDNYLYLHKTLNNISECKFSFSITTNALLINDNWIELFKREKYSVTVSIDGPKEHHDKHRHYVNGHGTFDATLEKIFQMRQSGVEVALLSVFQNGLDANDVYSLFVDEIGTKRFNVLFPDADYTSTKIATIAKFYKDLFDIWMERGLDAGINIDIAKQIVVGLVGGACSSEMLGYGALLNCTVMPDGSLEPLDVLRIAGDGHTASSVNIFDNSIDEIKMLPLWKDQLENSLNLPSMCQQCRHQNACGGGFLPHRYSPSNGYQNPTVYCQQILEILDYASARLSDSMAKSSYLSSLRMK